MGKAEVELKDSNTQILKNSRIQEFKNSRIQEFKNSRVRSQESGVCGCKTKKCVASIGT
jgi:hypothetical protein